MKTVWVVDDRPALRVPFDAFAHTAAVNRRNPVEPIGILHNALMSLHMIRMADDLYRGIHPNGDRLFHLVTRSVQSADTWVLNCICVTEQGCPCTDFLSWLRSNLPTEASEQPTFPRDLFPDHRPGPELVERAARCWQRCRWGGIRSFSH